MGCVLKKSAERSQTESRAVGSYIRKGMYIKLVLRIGDAMRKLARLR